MKPKHRYKFSVDGAACGAPLKFYQGFAVQKWKQVTCKKCLQLSWAKSVLKEKSDD